MRRTESKENPINYLSENIVYSIRVPVLTDKKYLTSDRYLKINEKPDIEVT